MIRQRDMDMNRLRGLWGIKRVESFGLLLLIPRRISEQKDKKKKNEKKMQFPNTTVVVFRGGRGFLYLVKF